jgi:hypothetical protein
MRQLREDKLLETVEKIRERISSRFPASGLSSVAAEVVQVTREAMERAEAIRRPDLWLRVGLGIVVVLALGGVVAYAGTHSDQTSTWQTLLQFLDVVKGSAAVLLAAGVFLFTLETRLKRRRLLRAVHELRAMAHIIDMHQLTKDPDRLGDPARSIDVGGQPLDAESLGRYLHYCTELLAIISKIGQLYVQDFPDGTAVTAVDHFEELATGLSSKIWQKLTMLDRMREEIQRPVEPAT